MGGHEDDWRVGGAVALADHAPTVQAVLGGVVSAWPDVLTEVQLTVIRTVTAEGLGLVPLRRPPTGPRRTIVLPENELMAFAEQFAVDVSRIDDDLRADFRAVMKEKALATAQAVYVSDMVPRARAALDALFGPDEWFDSPLSPTGQLSGLLDELVREIALLSPLDPVLTELVRLRAGRVHGCRICLSRRSLDAVEAGATAVVFQAVDHYRGSVLTPMQQAALGLVDGMLWTPADLRSRDVDAVREHLTPAQAVGVVLEVLTSSVAKVLVALGTDAPRSAGVQLFRRAPSGELSFP